MSPKKSESIEMTELENSKKNMKIESRKEDISSPIKKKPIQKSLEKKDGGKFQAEDMKINCMVGTIEKEEILRFKRLAFRSSKGNILSN